MARYRDFVRRAASTPPVVVLGEFTGPTAVGVARDMARLRVPVLMVDNNTRGACVPSRHAARLLCPDPFHEQAAFLGMMVDLGQELPQKAVLFPSRDDYLAAMAAGFSTLRQLFLLPYAKEPLVRMASDKWEQVVAARTAGLDVPNTLLLSSPSQLPEALSTMRFPAVLKPVTPQAGLRRLGLKAIEVRSQADLAAAYRRARGCGDLLLQEYIPGGEDSTYYLGSYLDAGSRPLAVFTGRRLRQHPAGYGLAGLAESVWVPEAAEQGLRLLASLDYHGVSQVEFKRDARDGRFKFIEINLRHYGTNALATACGVNLSAVAYDDMHGLPHLAPPQREGMRWIRANRDVGASVRRMRHRELRVAEWVASLRGVRVDGLYSLDDPLIGIADLVATANRGLARARAIRSPRPARPSAD